MSTLSINLRYRPLRIGWCVNAGDLAAIRRAMKLSFALWGGRFNPIIPVDDDAHATALLRLFRVDALRALSDTDVARAFVDRQRHLPWPLFNDEVFIGEGNDRRCQVVDLHHPIAKLYDETIGRDPDQTAPLHIHEWDPNDPLADVFLATYGNVSSEDTAGLDYKGLARARLLGQPVRIGLNAELPLFDRAAITFASLNRAYIERHYAVQNYWDSPGFFVGRAMRVPT